MKTLRFTALSLFALAAQGCVELPEPPNMDAGTNTDAGDGMIVAPCEIPAPENAPRFDAVSERPRFVVMGTDFSSAYFGWLNADGFAIDGNWINSGTVAAGLVTTLSGDVGTPTRLPGDGSYFYIDKYGTDVVTRVTIPQGVVLGQVRTHGESCGGFSSNPYDVVVVSPTQAFATRYGYDATGNASPECRGSDLLEFNPTTMTRTGNTVDLSSFGIDVEVRNMMGNLVTTHVQPRPARAFLTGNGFVVVGLERLSGDFKGSADGVLAVVNPATGGFAGHVVTGLKNCGGIFQVPGDRNRVAMLCTGFKKNDAMNASEPDKRDTSGIVVFEIGNDGAVTEIAGWRAAGHPSDPALAGDVLMLDSTHALVLKRGAWQSPTDKDDLYLMDLTTGAHTFVVSADKGYGFYGAMSFDPSTGLVLVPDVDAGIRRYRVNDTLTSVTVLSTITGLGAPGIPVTGTALVDIGTPTCN
jgi:hypothetical protein